MPTDKQLIEAMFTFPAWKGATVFEMCRALGIAPDMSPIVSQDEHARSPQVLLCAQMQRLFVGCACPDFGATAFFIKNAQLQIVHTPTDPRPADIAELAAQVAKELRKRGIWAHDVPGCQYVARFAGPAAVASYGVIPMAHSDFDNLGPIAIADVIQALEATRAQEWAGDK